MNQNELLKLGIELLKKNQIDDAEIKAKKLLEYILKQTREEFIINSLQEVTTANEEEYKNELEKIVQGKPLQYITHNQEFMGLDFYVDENVLIPQPDTEILVEQAIKIINYIRQNDLNKLEIYEGQKQKKLPIQILDLCTGSGAIAISIVKYIEKNNIKIKNNKNIINSDKYKKIKLIASDISNTILKVAKDNAIRNQAENIQFIQSDMFSKLSNYKFDIIISNPPYIETDIISTLSKEVQQEPKIALDGGKDGLDFYRCILTQADNYLKQNGYVLFEIGYNQGEKVLSLWKKLKSNNKCTLEIITEKPIQDLNGNNRVLIFQKPLEK